MGYPNNFSQYPQYQQYQPNYGMQQPQIASQQQTPQIQNGGFLIAPTEEFAINYPVGMGNCVTFKIEGKPIVIEKSMGFSQLESPKIERYRLVKEEIIQKAETEASKVEYVTTDDFNEKIKSIMSEIEDLKNEIPKPDIKKVSKRKDEGDD